MKLTILTPTYNRIEKLYTLYKSLCNQTNKEFIWYIIDDGSTEEVEKIIKEFIEKKQIIIKFAKKKNGGKHTALNYAIKKIETDLVFIVDNDDWLTEDAVEKVLKIHEKYENRNDICGYSFLRMYTNGNVNGKMLDEDEVIDDYINIRINGKDTNSDKAEVWKTKILKEYPFPEFEGEKFLGEDIVWVKMASKYKMVFLREAIYVSEYLSDGLTNNRRKNNINSPQGCFCRAETMLEIFKDKKVDFKYFIKVILQYQIYGLFSKKKFIDLYKKCYFKKYFIVLYPGAYFLYLKWRNENKLNG